MQHLAYVLMPVAFILLAAAYIPNNIRRLIKNPMMTATKLWAIVHLLMNGDLASVMLFSGFLFFAVVSVIMAKRFNLAKEHAPVAVGFDIVTVFAGIAATAGV
ncbi:MAG: putative membrane protein, partial [Pseudoalteromonas tetraodonis]